MNYSIATHIVKVDRQVAKGAVPGADSGRHTEVRNWSICGTSRSLRRISPLSLVLKDAPEESLMLNNWDIC